jgi:hypothetical protein
MTERYSMIRSGLVRMATVVAAAILVAPVAHAQVAVDFPLSVDKLPTYDRVNGLSIPFGPTITVGDERLVVNPALTYRSHIGKIDPSLSIVGQFTADSTVGFAVTGSRGTFTNDGWIRSNLINSLVAFGLGRDSRNYFRGDRGEARLTSSLHLPVDVATVFLGARAERDWSTGWRSGSNMGPYSIFNNSDTTNGIERPNPAIDAGHITSAIAGGHLEYAGLPASLLVDVRLEAAGKTPLGGNFQQLTLDEGASIKTVAGQHLDIRGHLVATATSSATPRQRYAYVGGSGSLATVDLLSLGGDHLYLLDALYAIPINNIEIPILGNPYIAPHFAMGAAAVGGFGRPAQNIGARLGVSIFTLDYVINPRTHKSDFGAGISLAP